MCGCVHRLLVVQSRLSYLLLSALCIEVLWAVLWGAVLYATFIEVCVHVLLFMCGCVHIGCWLCRVACLCLPLSALCIEVLWAVVSQLYRAVAYTYESVV